MYSLLYETRPFYLDFYMKLIDTNIYKHVFFLLFRSMKVKMSSGASKRESAQLADNGADSENANEEQSQAENYSMSNKSQYPQEQPSVVVSSEIKRASAESEDKIDLAPTSVIMTKRMNRVINTSGQITTEETPDDTEITQDKMQDRSPQEKPFDVPKEELKENPSSEPIPMDVRDPSKPFYYYKMDHPPGTATIIAEDGSQTVTIEHTQRQQYEDKVRTYENARYITREKMELTSRCGTPGPERLAIHEKHQLYGKPVYTRGLQMRNGPQQIIIAPESSIINGEVQTIAYQNDQRELITTEAPIITSDDRVIIEMAPARYQEVGSPSQQTIQYNSNSPMISGQMASPRTYQHSENMGSPGTIDMVQTAAINQQSLGITYENLRDQKYDPQDPNGAEQKSTTYTSLQPVTSNHQAYGNSYLVSQSPQYQSMPQPYHSITMYPGTLRGDESPPGTVLYRNNPTLASSSIQQIAKSGQQIIFTAQPPPGMFMGPVSPNSGQPVGSKHQYFIFKFFQCHLIFPFQDIRKSRCSIWGTILHTIWEC